ncbi:MAG: alkaline shock response membrane anchor protein AmaP [Deltaproteobacteria bacterium]
MRFFRLFGIYFYAIVLTLIGSGLIVFAAGWLPLDRINNLLSSLLTSPNTRIAVGLSGLLLILISISFAQLILNRFSREKTIGVPTASGELTISLSAIEDLIKHFTVILPEIKEIRPDVIAAKKRIIVNLRVVLKSETNLLDLTNRLQEITKAKIQEVLEGLDLEIVLKIHIAKIISREDKEKHRKGSEKEEPTIPFGGYGKYSI